MYKKNLVDFSSIFQESEIKSLKWEKNLDASYRNFSMGWIISFDKIPEPVIIIEKILLFPLAHKITKLH